HEEQEAENPWHQGGFSARIDSRGRTMSTTIRPLAEITQQATTILIREMGVVDALRFLSQFRTGTGDYTKERGQWLDDLSLEQIAAGIKARRHKPRREKKRDGQGGGQ